MNSEGNTQNNGSATEQKTSVSGETYHRMRVMRWSFKRETPRSLPMTADGEEALIQTIDRLGATRPVGRPGAILSVRESWVGLLLSALTLDMVDNGRLGA